MTDVTAQLAYPAKRAVAIVGDSAFGFRYLILTTLVLITSAMEIETAVRTGLPVIIFVINNNGIYFGLDASTYKQARPLPSTALTPDTRYDLIAQVCSVKQSLTLGMWRKGVCRQNSCGTAACNCVCIGRN